MLVHAIGRQLFWGASLLGSGGGLDSSHGWGEEGHQSGQMSRILVRVGIGVGLAVPGCDERLPKPRLVCGPEVERDKRDGQPAKTKQKTSVRSNEKKK